MKRSPPLRPVARLHLERRQNVFSSGRDHDFRAKGLPQLPPPDVQPCTPLAGLPRIDIGVAMDFTADEIEQISAWLAEAPHVTVGLSDLVRARGYRQDAARLIPFARARRLSLHLQRAPDLQFLGRFHELESLIVFQTKCPLELPTLPTLRSLLVYQAPLPDLRSWALPALTDLRLPKHPAPEHLDALPALRFLVAGVGDLEALARLPLEGLDLRGVAADTDLSPLARSKTLEFVALSLHTPEQADQLARLPRLRSLRIVIPDHAPLEWVEALRGHPTLERVMVAGLGWQRTDEALRAMGFAAGQPGDWPTD